MSKEKKKIIIKDASGKVIAEINKPRYVMIPVEPAIKADLKELCKLSGGGLRSQGAMTGKLIREALAKKKLEIDTLKM